MRQESGSASAPTILAATGDSVTINDSRGQTSTRSRNAPNRQAPSGSDPISFEGACPDIGAVLALRSERITKKTDFSVFVENVADYVIANPKYGSDIEQCI